MKLKNKILGWLSLPWLLCAAACSDNAIVTEPDHTGTDGKNVITLSVSTQTALSTRAAEYPTISDGSKADMLLYSVYEKGQDGKYKLVTDYLNEENGGINKIVNASFPLTIQLIMDPNDTYTVVFWAQSSLCNAYNTDEGLTKVKVDYSQIPTNNYELADAFCNIADVKGDQGTQTVELRRPLAQINVGDAGWDYEAAARLKPNPRTYAKSSVTVKGLAQYYNVLEGRTLTANDLTGTDESPTCDATFALDYMPAFINLKSYDSDFEWEKLSYLPYSKEFGPRVGADGEVVGYEEVVGKEEEGEPFYDSEIEVFLKLRLNTTDADTQTYTYNRYYGYAPQKSIPENFERKLTETETFKYLSMCYVLVPTSKDEDGNVKGTVLDSFSFTVADANDENSKDLFTISNLPVQQNWRTNILTDKLFMTDEKFRLYIVPTYAGDFLNDSESNSGDSHDKWHNVTMHQKDDDTTIWYVSDVEKGYGNVNSDFKGYEDEDKQYDDWDEEQDQLHSSQGQEQE